MAMKDAQVPDPDPTGRVELYLPGQRPGEADVVVPCDDGYLQAVREQSGKELENLSPQRGRCPDDRLLHVARHDQRAGTSGACHRQNLRGDLLGSTAGWTRLARLEAPESEVDVRDDEKSARVRPGPAHMEERVTRNRTQNFGCHPPSTFGSGIDLPRRAAPTRTTSPRRGR